MAQSEYGTRTDQEIIGKIHLIDDGSGNYGKLTVDGTTTLTGAVTTSGTLNTNGVATSAVPAVTTPAIPSSQGTSTTLTVNAFAYITGGTVSVIKVTSGTATAFTASPATVYVPAGAAISLTYSAAPTWQWQAF